MDPVAYVEWVELQHLIRERYPDLPLDEAYLNVLHDAFVKLPKDCMERMKPMLPHLVQQSPEILESISIYGGHPLMRFFSQLAGITRNARSKSIASNTDTRSSVLAEAASNSVPVSAEAVSASAKLAADNMKGATDSADCAVRQVCDIHVIGKSLVDRIDYYRRWMQIASAIQIAQGHKAIQALTEIRDHLGESNSITVSGSGGPDGFAQHVYDFVKEGTDNIDEAEGNKHRFFVYNPDTDWYGAFRRLIGQNPLPPTFCAKSDNLDTLCQYMQCVRAQCGQGIIFHLLIPTWYSISIKEPLHFPDCLQPFQVEGRKHKGKPLVEFNLPAAHTGLLHGVANIIDPNCSNAIAEGVSVAVTGPTVGWGINGICLALGTGLGVVTGLGPLIAIPVWVGTGIPAMSYIGPAMKDAIYDSLCEVAPRILGSHQRLGMTP
ncbi:hypothetical protein BU24DRAFT_427945 [Aaosphaeria arxii CBS 175.79]|uniref:Uncharacterized protein n=1 Tax=Aaosphaeria arxii CBS 175.79 TaxID=1450172 RepID=A0A6A5XAH6_9PLEO|nr:uncharacterized protein BU24DRAFT_427945 [Aaosphaeria arxii CBS 175.79]KAF2009913.1 hypothetical protein BU24DRAFT_427945 [Aaosphaeria arxii CBS 175.79]